MPSGAGYVNRPRYRTAEDFEFADLKDAKVLLDELTH